MLGKFYYPVVFLNEEDGITVTFPNFDYLVSCATSMHEAYEKAEECLGIGIRDALEETKDIPQPVDIKAIKLEVNQTCAIISVDMDRWMEEHNKKTIKRNITIPKWLDTLARKNGINVSGVCQKALIKELHIKS